MLSLGRQLQRRRLSTIDKAIMITVIITAMTDTTIVGTGMATAPLGVMMAMATTMIVIGMTTVTIGVTTAIIVMRIATTSATTAMDGMQEEAEEMEIIEAGAVTIEM